MQQLRCAVLDKLNNLSRAEMNIFLLLVRHQDNQGAVIGVYYKEVCEELGIKSKQTFYNVLTSLKEKGLIDYRQENGDYDITVLNNACWNREENAPYIDLNRNIFRSRRFYRMKGHEKYLLLDFMRSTAQNGGRRVIGVKEFYKKYKQIFRVTVRVIQQYLHTIRKYFEIFIRNGNYHIRFTGGESFAQPKTLHRTKNRAYEMPYTAAEAHRDYIGNVLLRRNKIRDYTAFDASDLGTLTHQYADCIEQSGHKVLSIFRMVLEAYREREGDKPFNIKVFHKLLKRAVE